MRAFGLKKGSDGTHTARITTTGAVCVGRCPLLLLAALFAVAYRAAGEEVKPSGYYAAHILAFPQEGGPCEHSGDAVTRIGGSPACFTVGDSTELYLCSSRGHVLISHCKETDCTQCDVPALNQYGYVDGKCQANGWLRADCTDIPVGEDRFLPQDQRSSL